MQLLGEEHPDTLSCLNNLAVWYGYDGDFETALELAGKCYVLRVNVLGEEHPDTLGTAQLIKVIEEALEEEFE